MATTDDEADIAHPCGCLEMYVGAAWATLACAEHGGLRGDSHGLRDPLRYKPDPTRKPTDEEHSSDLRSR